MITAKYILEKTNIPIRDARLLIAKIKNITYEKIFLYPEKIHLSDEEQSIFFNMLLRYKNEEPISKITNKKTFWKYDFFVNCDVLDPRPETELIIEHVLSRIHKSHNNKNDFSPLMRTQHGESKIKFLDIGTGSGCILLSLLHEYPNAIGVGIDISEKAIKTAEYNKNILNIKNAIFLNIGWSNLENYFDEKFDVIVSNPPYIKSCDINSLEKNVKNYDPLISLDGGDDGLNSYKEIAKISRNILSTNGKIFLEVGYNQAQDVKTIFSKNGFVNFEIIKDCNEIDRLVIVNNSL